MPNPDKNKGGRPPKYANPEQRKAAHAQQTRESRRRQQQQQHQSQQGGIQIAFDPRSIFQDGPESSHITARELGIQADDLDIPVDHDLREDLADHDLQDDIFPSVEKGCEDADSDPVGVERTLDRAFTGTETRHAAGTGAETAVETEARPDRSLSIRTRNPTVSSPRTGPATVVRPFPTRPPASLSQTRNAPSRTTPFTSPPSLSPPPRDRTVSAPPSTFTHVTRYQTRSRSAALNGEPPGRDRDPTEPAERTRADDDEGTRTDDDDDDDNDDDEEEEGARINGERAAEEEEEGEEEAVDIAQKLAEQLVEFHGCPAGAHERMERKHDRAVTEHTPLEEVSHIMEALPDTLASETILQHGQFTHSEAKEWSHAFTGTRPGREQGAGAPAEKMHVCLHASDRPALGSQVTSDIDSILAFPSNLAVARQGIRFNLNPHVVSNLSTDVHLKLAVTVEDRQRLVPLHKVPHYLMAQVMGMEVSIYVFFPRLYRPDASNSYLKQATLQRWTDRVLLPAIYGQTSASTAQHYPASYRHGKLSSQARNAESHAALDRSGSRHQFIHHFLQPEVLEEIWDIVVHTTEEAGFEDFGGVQLFLTGKNFKVWTKSPTWRGVWESFFHRWDQTIDAVQEGRRA